MGNEKNSVKALDPFTRAILESQSIGLQKILSANGGTTNKAVDPLSRVILENYKVVLQNILSNNGSVDVPDLNKKLFRSSALLSSHPPESARRTHAPNQDIALVRSDTGEFVRPQDTLISGNSIQRMMELTGGLIMTPQGPKFKKTTFTYYVAKQPADMPMSITDFINDLKSKNPHLQPANSKENTLTAIEGAMGVINEEMAGKIKLVPTSKPEGADIVIAGVGQATTFDGINSANGKLILLDQSSIGRISPDLAQGLALHEIRHALGFEHPHNYQKRGNAASSKFVLCEDSALAYNGICVGNNGVPTHKSGRADLAAMRQLYDPEYFLSYENSNLLITMVILQVSEKRNSTPKGLLEESIAGLKRAFDGFLSSSKSSSVPQSLPQAQKTVLDR